MPAHQQRAADIRRTVEDAFGADDRVAMKWLTTMPYLGCKQNLSHPVNDRFEIMPLIAGPD